MAVIKVEEAVLEVMEKLSKLTGKPKEKVLAVALRRYLKELERRNIIEKMVKAAKQIKSDPEALKDIEQLDELAGDGF